MLEKKEEGVQIYCFMCAIAERTSPSVVLTNGSSKHLHKINLWRKFFGHHLEDRLNASVKFTRPGCAIPSTAK